MSTLLIPDSVDELQEALAAGQYIARRELAVSTFLALRLRRLEAAVGGPANA